MVICAVIGGWGRQPARGAEAASGWGQTVPVEGRRFAARLLGIEPTGQLLLRDEQDRDRRLHIERLTWWGGALQPGRGHLVLLSDGTLLLGNVSQIDPLVLTLQSPVWGEVLVPRPLVRAVIWQPPPGALALQRLLDRARDASNGPGDQEELLMANNDQFRGRLLRCGGRVVDFEMPSLPLRLDREQVGAWIPAAAAGAPADDGAPQWRCLVGLRDGSRLMAAAITLRDRLTLRLQCGLELNSDPVVDPVEDQLVSLLQPRSRRVRYLSDLPPLGYRHVPYLTASWPWRADRDVLGGPLQSGRHIYPKGIGMHSTARLAYALDRSDYRLEADVALDASAGQGGSVVFRIFSSPGGTEWQEVFQSDVVCGGDPPRPVSVDLSGARRLALIVDFADRADQLDRANWLAARLVRPE
jgi:hypothetical protein